jgi:hypothetical protein
MQGPLPDVQKDGPLARRERWEEGARSAGERKDERILSSFRESVNKVLDARPAGFARLFLGVSPSHFGAVSLTFSVTPIVIQDIVFCSRTSLDAGSSADASR